LQLNLPRIRRQRAMVLAWAQQLASGDDHLDDSWGDALACCPEEGSQVSDEMNTARAMSRTRRRAGMG
jgi:hypothetical protein